MSPGEQNGVGLKVKDGGVKTSVLPQLGVEMPDHRYYERAIQENTVVTYAAHPGGQGDIAPHFPCGGCDCSMASLGLNAIHKLSWAGGAWWPGSPGLVTNFQILEITTDVT